MESAKFLLLLIGFVETTPLYSIVTPPSPATGKLGGTAEFDCEVDYANILVMEWDFNNNRIYSIQNNNQDYPMGRDRYSVTQNGKHFTLRIKDLQSTDAGKYTCQVPTQSEGAHLIVLDSPKVLTLSPKPEEGSTAEYKCTAGFTGPSKEHISAENYPQLRVFFNDEPMNATTQEQFNSSTNYYKLVQVLNMTLNADMNQKKLMCDIGTLSPVVHVKSTIEVEVLYSVRNITYTPNQEWYEVGMVINCTADGNPEPNFIWDDFENKGNHINGKSLTITQAMVGGNTWRCLARNIIGECSHQDSVSAIFEVVLPGQTPGQIQSNDASKIALGITILVCAAVGCLIVLFVYHHLKHNRHDGATAMVPLLRSEDGSVLPQLTIFCCDDGREWEEKIKEIYSTKTKREVQTFDTLKKLKANFTRSNRKEGTDATDKLMIILSKNFKDHVFKYAASLTDYPELLPKTTVLVDLPATEIPDWLEKHHVDYIDTRKYDDIEIRKKISESIFGEALAMASMKRYHGRDTVQNPIDRLPVGSIGESLAWAYFFNYIQYIGPSIVKGIKKFEKAQEGAWGHMPKKSFILLPSSCNCPNNLHDVDAAITGAGKLKPLHIDVAGNKRVYEPAVYKITTEGKTYFACVEYCGSVHVFYEMTIKLVADLSPIEKRAQMHTFYQVLKEIMEHPTLPQFCQSIHLVPFDDESDHLLSEILIKEIKNCL